MAYHNYRCKAYNIANANNNLIIFSDNENIYYVYNGLQDSVQSTSSANVTWTKSCANNAWNKSVKTYRINMDNALRNAVNSKINGGLVNLQNYLSNIPELQGKDLNGNNTFQVFGYICKNHALTGSFMATTLSTWDGNWPINYPLSLVYSYDIPSVGNVSDTVILLTNGWYTRGSQRKIVGYAPSVKNILSEQTLLNPPGSWVNGNYPFTPNNGIQAYNYNTTLAYYVINGIYSRNAGTKGLYVNNAADAILDAGSNYFGGLTQQTLVQIAGAANSRTYISNNGSITNNVIMAITDVNFVNNTITVQFALSHDRNNSMVAFLTDKGRSFAAIKMDYNYPITSVHNNVDNWQLTFIEDHSFNPNVPNGNGPSTAIWDSANNAVLLTAGSYVNNDHGWSKIISSAQGQISCSCSNINNTIRFNIGGYSVTIPSNIVTFDVKILAVNDNNFGYWRVRPPGVGMTHSFSLVYPSTENAPIASFENELYTAIVQAVNQPSEPFVFQVQSTTNEYTISVSGLVRCDLITKGSKKYYTISVYDVDGDFSMLLVKNGTYATMPVTLTIDCQIVNNTLLVKAGMASVGFTNTSIGDIPLVADAIAVMLPAVATVSKNGAKIGYASTTVNQSSFAFSFSALKEEVDETDDFVSHYLQ